MNLLYFRCLTDIFENEKFLVVKAKTPEKAAKKMYRSNKRRFAEIGYVYMICVDDETEWNFDISKWTQRGSNKMISKPKK
jgi:hypothetical protein